MSEADQDRVERRVEALRRRWIKALGLERWKTRVDYHDGPFRDNSDVTIGHECVMGADVDWRYETAVINVDCRAAVDRDDKELEEIWVHELAHLWLKELRVVHDDEDQAAVQASREQIDHEEHAATLVGRALLGARAAGERDARLRPRYKMRRTTRRPVVKGKRS